MNVDRAREYYDVIDSPDSSPADLAEMYSEEAVLKSPREGTFTGRESVEEFYGLNEEFFAEGAHNMTEFYADGNTVVCEGTVKGKTTAGREYEGVGLVDVFEFDESRYIDAHRIYLDYSAIVSDLPEDNPSFDD